MSIKIKNINVKNLGPLSPLKRELGQLNLVYGNNEAGKSYLVEFLIHSLFKPQKWSNLRDNLGTGKVTVEGLGSEEVDFSPDKKTKLNDKLSEKEQYIGLPPDFSKLLVIRPADIELGRDKESDKLMLRRFLSHKEILDQIEDNIEQESIKKCQISGYQIDGDNRGKISDRHDLKNKLEKINSLFEEVEEKYFGGELFQLKEGKRKLEQELEKLEKAKRHRAFNLNEQRQKLEQKANKINQAVIDQLVTQYTGLKRDEVNIRQQEKELADLKKDTKHYQWLNKAVEIYQEFNLDSLPHRPRLLLLTGLAAGFLLTGIFFILNLQLVGIISLAVTAASVVFLIILQDRYLKEFGKQDELNNLKNEFQNLFNRKLNSLADLKAEKDNLTQKYHKKQVLEEKLVENKRSFSSDKAVLVNKVNSLLNREITFDQSQKVLEQQKQKKRDWETKLNKLNQQLAVLGVKEENYLEQASEIDYDQAEEEKLNSKINKIEDQIQEKESQLDSLKHRIMGEINANSSGEIADLIEPLAEKRQQTLNRYKQITAEIIAKKNVYQVIKKLYQAEDEKIENVLNSDLINQLLPQVTTRYNEIYLEDESLMVKDAYNSFQVSQLSSGAKEQVFLSLRIALASEWFKQEKMFLILDDAFIHSDRHRKAKLVKSVINLSQSGWQVICFSFDDRIKKMFDQNTEDYKLIDLNKK